VSQERNQQMDALVRRRKACHACAGLENPSAIANGALDGDELGPWTRWQGRLDAEVVVVGQDWGDVAAFTKNGGLEPPGNPTNARLVELLGVAGINVGPPATLGRSGTVFFTNAILCMKQDGLQGAVKSGWFDACGARFLRTAVDIVSPRAVVTLGTHATDSVCRTFGVVRAKRFAAAVDAPDGLALPGGIRLFPRYHCGARSMNMNRTLEQQHADWGRLGAWLAAARRR
jgi:DNA polymerase